MSNAPEKPAYRKRRLFPRSLQEVVKDATKPMMDAQGKLYGALLRDWVEIVGPERAALCKPERLQFAAKASGDAILHLAVRPAAAPELAYATEQMLDQCARYFGYRAVARMVLHPTHGLLGDAIAPEAKPAVTMQTRKPLPANVPPEMRAVLERMATLVASASDKKD